MWKPLVLLTVACFQIQTAFAGLFNSECGSSWDARATEKILECAKDYKDSEIQAYLTAHHLPASDLVSVVAIKSKKTGKVVMAPYFRDRKTLEEVLDPSLETVWEESAPRTLTLKCQLGYEKELATQKLELQECIRRDSAHSGHQEKPTDFLPALSEGSTNGHSRVMAEPAGQ